MSSGETLYIGLREIADTLSIKYSMAHKLVRTRRLRALFIGRVVRVLRSDLEEFVRKNTTDVSPSTPVTPHQAQQTAKRGRGRPRKNAQPEGSNGETPNLKAI